MADKPATNCSRRQCSKRSGGQTNHAGKDGMREGHISYQGHSDRKHIGRCAQRAGQHAGWHVLHRKRAHREHGRSNQPGDDRPALAQQSKRRAKRDRHARRNRNLSGQAWWHEAARHSREGGYEAGGNGYIGNAHRQPSHVTIPLHPPAISATPYGDQSSRVTTSASGCTR